MNNLTLVDMDTKLREWLGNSGWINYDIFIEKSSISEREKVIRVYIYTDKNRYSIVAIPTGKSRSTYLGCIASSRKSRAGETWVRGSDLPDGEFSKEIWDSIVNRIIAYESVDIHQFKFEEDLEYYGILEKILEVELTKISNRLIEDLKYITHYLVTKYKEGFYLFDAIPPVVRVNIMSSELIEYNFINNADNYRNYKTCLDFLFAEIFQNIDKSDENVIQLKNWLSQMRNKIPKNIEELDQLLLDYLEELDIDLKKIGIQSLL